MHTEKKISIGRYHKYLSAGAIAVITFLVYLPCLENKFVSWDDNVYVYQNPHIKSFNLGFLKWAFFDFYAANWHPLTWVSHALDYAIWGLDPVGHHLTNIILHALNTAVVVIVTIRLLSLYRDRTIHPVSPWLTDRSILIAGIVTGFIFGLHPVHVESVAWVSERKDLLCALFFLLSILAYARYVSDISTMSTSGLLKRFMNKYYLLTAGLFVLALLSKPMAVTLPLVLLLLDWYPLNRSQSSKEAGNAFIEKLPFFALSIASSVLTIMAHKAGGAMKMMAVVPLPARVLVAIKSLIGYLLKMMFPINLIPYYPYPSPKDVSFLSLAYPITLVLVAGITVVCLVMAKRQKLWLAVWLYYVVTLIPVIGIVQVGGQSMADRYTYLPSLGPFLLIGLMVAWSWNMAHALKTGRAIAKLVGVSVGVFLSVTMVYLTVEQIGIWKDSMTFWSYVIEKEPGSVPFAYNSRAAAFVDEGKFDKAIEDLDKAIALDPSNYQTYTNEGKTYGKMGKLDMAIEYFNLAIALNPSDYEAYFSRGITFGRMKQYDKAIEDLDKAIALDPSHPEAFYFCGYACSLIGKKDQAITDLKKACDLGYSPGCSELKILLSE